MQTIFVFKIIEIIPQNMSIRTLGHAYNRSKYQYSFLFEVSRVLELWHTRRAGASKDPPDVLSRHNNYQSLHTAYTWFNNLQLLVKLKDCGGSPYDCDGFYGSDGSVLDIL